METNQTRPKFTDAAGCTWTLPEMKRERLLLIAAQVADVLGEVDDATFSREFPVGLASAVLMDDRERLGVTTAEFFRAVRVAPVQAQVGRAVAGAYGWMLTGARPA